MVGGREVIENNPLTVAEDLSIDSHFGNNVLNLIRKSDKLQLFCLLSC